MKEVIRLDNIRRDFVVGDEVVHAPVSYTHLTLPTSDLV